MWPVEDLTGYTLVHEWWIVIHGHSRSFHALPRVEKSDSCQYLQTAQYRVNWNQGEMTVLDSWYRAEGWRSTGIVQSQSWDQPSANYRLRSDASTEPVHISLLSFVFNFHSPFQLEKGRSKVAIVKTWLFRRNFFLV